MRAKDYRKAAWTKLSGNWGTMALIVLVEGLIIGTLSSVTVGVGSLLVAGPLALGFAGCAMIVQSGEKVKFERMFDGFKQFGSSLALYIVNTIFVFLWSLLFVIPGIIASYRYAMSYFILKDNPEMSGSEARRKSIEMMRGHKWQLFCLHFSFIGWYILCILTLGILTFWVTPYVKTAEAEFYQNLKNANAE